MSARILVVGGYGTVGAPLCASLRDDGHRVVVAGRNFARAAALARQLQAEARHLDLDRPATWASALEGLDMVIMCMDQGSIAFVEAVLERDVHYADITASDAFFRMVASLPPPVRSAALLSLGLAPGLTNLMAAAARAQLDAVDRLDIGLLFGLGDVHGKAALDWLAARIFDADREHRSRVIDYGPQWGRRRAHPVDFSDQHSLARTWGVPAETRVTFESRAVTATVFGLSRLVGRNRRASRLARASLGGVRFGSDAVHLTVTATGRRHGAAASVTLRFDSRGEALTTARLVAVQVAAFLAEPPEPGIWHSHEVLDPGSQFATLAASGCGQVTADLTSPAKSGASPTALPLTSDRRVLR